MLSQEQLEKEIEFALRKQQLKDRLHLRDPSMDSIKITPRVSFFEGTPTHPIRHITSGHGRLVQAGLLSHINLMGASDSASGAYLWMHSFGVGSSGVPAVPSIRLGIGTAATVYNTTQLSNIINTPPNTITGSVTNPSSGVYRVVCNATWNAGVLGTPTITEAGLFARSTSTLQPFQQSSVNTGVVNLVDRICSTNNDFSAFTVNASYPLTCQYTLQVSYA